MVAKLIHGLTTHVPLKPLDLISVADNYLVCFYQLICFLLLFSRYSCLMNSYILLHFGCFLVGSFKIFLTMFFFIEQSCFSVSNKFAEYSVSVELLSLAEGIKVSSLCHCHLVVQI